MNTELALVNLLQGQLRTYNITNAQILALFAEIPREKFVPSPFRDIALADTTIPLAHGYWMIPPKEEARIAQTLTVQSSDKILVVGSAGSYLTAILAKLGQEVTYICHLPEIITLTQQALQTLDINNVTITCADLKSIYNHDPFDVIVIVDALPYLPEELQNCLVNEGRLFAVLGKPPIMEATLIKRVAWQWQSTLLFETLRPQLSDFAETSRFQF